MDSSRVGWGIDRRFFAVIAVIFPIFSSGAGASGGRAVPLEERAQGASQIVVATVTSVTPRWAVNEFGDRLIVSRLSLRVVETLKGAAAASLSMDIEGGTLDGLTLRVSTLPALEPGNRAVFYLDAMAGGAYRPHLAGLGILELDDADVVRGSSLRLDTVRASVRQAAGSVQR